MKKVTFYTAGVCLCFLLLLSACAPPQQVAKKITVESGQIPPEMQTEDFTLIGVLQGRKSYDKYVEKEFNDYTGKYVLSTYDELKTTYKDVDKYRYLMDCNQSTDQYYNPTSPGSNHSGYSTAYGYHYYILDRKTNKVYKKKSGSSFFALEMKSYLQAIDAARKK